MAARRALAAREPPRPAARPPPRVRARSRSAGSRERYPWADRPGPAHPPRESTSPRRRLLHGLERPGDGRDPHRRREAEAPPVLELLPGELGLPPGRHRRRQRSPDTDQHGRGAAGGQRGRVRPPTQAVLGDAKALPLHHPLAVEQEHRAVAAIGDRLCATGRRSRGRASTGTVSTVRSPSAMITRAPGNARPRSSAVRVAPDPTGTQLLCRRSSSTTTRRRGHRTTRTRAESSRCAARAGPRSAGSARSGRSRRTPARAHSPAARPARAPDRTRAPPGPCATPTTGCGRARRGGRRPPAARSAPPSDGTAGRDPWPRSHPSSTSRSHLGAARVADHQQRRPCCSCRSSAASRALTYGRERLGVQRDRRRPRSRSSPRRSAGAYTTERLPTIASGLRRRDSAGTPGSGRGWIAAHPGARSARAGGGMRVRARPGADRGDRERRGSHCRPRSTQPPPLAPS